MINLDSSLTKDDIKVVKHLRAIDNLFKKGNLTIHSLFSDNGNLYLTKIYNGKEYEIESFDNIVSDGGDPDRCGEGALYPISEWIDMIMEFDPELLKGDKQ